MSKGAIVLIGMSCRGLFSFDSYGYEVSNWVDRGAKNRIGGQQLQTIKMLYYAINKTSDRKSQSRQNTGDAHKTSKQGNKLPVVVALGSDGQARRRSRAGVVRRRVASNVLGLHKRNRSSRSHFVFKRFVGRWVFPRDPALFYTFSAPRLLKG